MPGNTTILVVDDDAVVRNVVKRVLERVGYRVQQAPDGNAALEIAASQRISLVLTDCSMPMMSGQALAEALRGNYPALPIVFMSGVDEGSLALDDVRPASFLPKPFGPESLGEAVAGALATARSSLERSGAGMTRNGALLPFDEGELDRAQDSICALSPELRIVWVNAAWRRFAEANGGRWDDDRELGRPFMASVPAVLQPYYMTLFERSRAERLVLQKDYECSTPTVQQLFRMRVMPCDSGALVVVHSLLKDMPHEGPHQEAADPLYSHAGLIRQCAHCRRVQRAGINGQWDFVSDYVARSPANTSHVLCGPCAAYFYPPHD